MENLKPENIDCDIEDVEVSGNEESGKKRKPKQRSFWREFSFLFHQICYIVRPNISLEQIFQNWQSIRLALAESPRQRQLQGTGAFHAR